MSVIYTPELEVRISIKYNETADAEQVGQLLAGILKQGLYQVSDPVATVGSNSQSNMLILHPFTTIIRNNNISYLDSETGLARIADVAIKAEAKVDQVFSDITYNAPYLIVELWSEEESTNKYVQDTELTIRVRAISYDDYDSDYQVIIGKCLFRDDAGIKDELYGFETANTLQESPIYNSERWLGQFVSEVTGGLEVTIKGGELEGETVSSRVLTYGGVGDNPSIPPSGFHRFDLIYVDSANNIEFIEGEEEIDPNDGETLPSKRSLGLYNFPISYIYISSRFNGVAPNILESAYIYNIIPRFMRKVAALENTSYDIIISSKAEMDAYFGNNTLSDQGGVSPGLYDDGFDLDYIGGVKSVYPKGKRIFIKNLFDGSGNPVEYELYNRVVLQSNTEVITGNNVIIKYMNEYAKFEVSNNTNFIVDKYGVSSFDILSESTYRTDPFARDYGDVINIAVGDKLACFSSEDGIVGKYSVSSVLKTIKGDIEVSHTPGPEDDNVEILDGSSINISTKDFSVVDYGLSGENFKRLIVVYINSSGNVELNAYKMNPITNKFEECLDSGAFEISSGAGWENVKIVKNSTRFVVTAGNGSSLQCFICDISDADDTLTFSSGFSSYVSTSGEQIENSGPFDDGTYSIYLEEDNSLHLVGVNGTNLRYLKGVETSSPSVDANYDSFVSTSLSVTGDASINTKIGLIVDEDNDYRIVTFHSSSQIFSSFYYNGSSWGSQKTLFTFDITVFFQSKIVKSEDNSVGAYPYYVVFTGNVYSVAEPEVNFATLDSDGDIDNIQQINRYSNGSSISFIDIKVNEDNLFPGETPLIQILVNEADVSTYAYTSYNGGVTWNTTTLTVGEEDVTEGFIAAFTNDFMVAALYNGIDISGGYSDKTYLFHYPYIIVPTINEVIEDMNATSVILSLDFGEKVSLKVKINTEDLPSISGDTSAVVVITNSIFSDFDIGIINSDYYAVIKAGLKTFGNCVKVNMGENVRSSNAISELSHSNVMNSFIKVNDSDKSFTGCLSLNVVSHIGGSPTIGTGDMDL